MNRENWNNTIIGNIATIVNGYAFDSKQFNEESKGIPLIRIRDVLRGYSETYTTEQADEKFLIKEGDLLIGMDGEFNCSLWKSIPSYLNQRVCKIDVNSSKACLEYIFYSLHRKLKEIESKTSFVTVKHISSKQIENIEIPLPPLDVQKQIALNLDQVTKVIAEHKELLAKYDLLIKSRFIEMFGDPVTNPMGWEVKKLGDLLESIRYGTSTPPKFSETGYAFIRATNIKKGRIIDEDMKFISESESKKIQKCQLKGNEILIVRSGVNSGDTCVVSEKYINQFAGYDMILELGEKLNPIYLNELINTKYMEKIVKPLTRRAAQPHLNSEQTQSFPIILPPLELQKQFADFVQQIDKSKLVVQQSLEKAETLYKSLMQEYFG